jgi:hypothetical protein
VLVADAKGSTVELVDPEESIGTRATKMLKGCIEKIVLSADTVETPACPPKLELREECDEPLLYKVTKRAKVLSHGQGTEGDRVVRGWIGRRNDEHLRIVRLPAMSVRE